MGRPTQSDPPDAGPTPRQLLACLEGVADGVIVGDLQGNVTYWNSAALRMHGYTSAAEARRHLSEYADVFVLTRADGEIVPFDQWPLARLARGEAVAGFEAAVTRTDAGLRRVLQYDGAAIVADAGRPQVMLTVRDVTEQRLAEGAAAEAQSHLRQLIESLPQLVWTCRGSDGACDYASPQFVRYTGVPPERLRDAGWVEQVHPDDRVRMGADWGQALATGRAYQSEYRLKGADGAYRWFAGRAVPVRDPSGRVSRWFGTSTDVHDARLAAEARAVLAAIVEHSTDAIVGKSLDGTITSWNRAAHRMFGYAADEAIGRNVVMLLPADRPHEERDIMARIHAGQGIEHFESRRVARDGEVIDVSLTISPIRDPVGRVVGASKIARNITARLAADRAVRTSYGLLRAMVEGIDDPIYLKGRDGRYLLGNAALGRAMGRPLSAVIGETADHVFGPDRATAMRESDRQVIDGGATLTYEEAIAVHDGPRHYLTTKAPYRDADGQVVGILGISRDVTPLKSAERALRESERHLRGVLDGLLVYVAVLRPGGQLAGMNRAMRVALVAHGVDVDAIDGQPVLDVPMPGVSVQILDRLRAAVGRAAAGEEARLDAAPLADGDAGVVLDLTFSPMRGEDGRVSHLVVSAVDVTDRERAARQARDRQAALAHLERVRTMGHMAAGLAHELTQPFGAIRNYAAACRRLLAGGRMPAERLGQVLGDIGAEAARAGAIVQRLRGFVQKQQLQEAAVAINDVVADAVRLFEFDLRQAGVETRVELAEGLPPVRADAVQVGQVLVNLIRNALDATSKLGPDRRLVVVRTAAVDHQVRVSVRDQGCGIPAKELGRVFDAFFTTKPDGLGIGLALCRTIVEEHGGQLSAEANPGGGMTFAFTLRAAE